MRSLKWLWLVMVAALALVPAACGRDEGGGGGGGGSAESDPGITKTSIKLGGSYPFSGPASAYGTIGEGAKAYFKFVNAKGGVNGRKIDFITLDDGYEPPKALQNARRLVQQDKVFAMFNTLGTPNNLAIWDYLNQQKVPQLYVADRRVGLGHGHQGAPVHDRLAAQLRHRGQGLRRVPQEGEAERQGRGAVPERRLRQGPARRLQGGHRGQRHQDRQGGDLRGHRPDGRGAGRRLARSGADTFLNITTPKFAAQAIATVAKSGWKPLHILNNVGASKNLVLKPVGLANAKGIDLDDVLQGPARTRSGPTTRR